jgi:hypothetical protein
MADLIAAIAKDVGVAFITARGDQSGVEPALELVDLQLSVPAASGPMELVRVVRGRSSCATLPLVP